MNRFGLRVLRKLGLLKKLHISGCITLEGRKIKIPIIKELGMGNLSMSEQWMLSTLKKILAIQKGNFLDVGVNIGQTLIKLRCIDPLINYIGFEPNPTAVYYSENLIKINKFKNCKIIPCGLGENDGILELNLYSDNDADAGASMISNFRRADAVKKKIYIPVFSVSTIKETVPFDQVAIIKIDVEGAELEVLQSLQGTLEKDRAIILMEILPVYDAKNIVRKERQDSIEAILTKMGYLIYQIKKTKDDKLKDYKLLSTIGIHSDINQCDYILLPKELQQQFEKQG